MQCHLNVLTGTSKYYKYYLTIVSFIWCLISDHWIWNSCCCGCHAAAHFQGLSCPAFPLGQDPFLTYHPLHVCSPQNVRTLFAGVTQQFCFCFEKGCEQLFPPFLWPRSPIWAQPEAQWRWHQPFRSASLHLCPSPAQPGPSHRMASWPGLSTSLSPGSCLCPGLGLPPSCPIPCLERWGCALPAPWGAPTASTSEWAAGFHWHTGATIAW